MKATILNAGDGAWVFEDHANRMSKAIGIPVSSTPADYNYVLGWEDDAPPTGSRFVPFKAILLAGDKRHQARAFERHGVVTPQTYLLDSQDEIQTILRTESQHQWLLKWPTGCGAVGHRLQDLNTPIPRHWPRPYILQQFIRMDVPEVYRLYCVANKTFGWNVRRFPPGADPSLFVAHANGARYEASGPIPPIAGQLARQALTSTGLIDSFGCVDLIRDETSKWLVLEVGTDGIFNHVDRNIDIDGVADEIDAGIAVAFRDWSRG